MDTNKIFDTHAHYDDEDYDVDREEVFSNINKAGVGYVVDVGASMSSSRAALELAKTHDFMYCSLGIHPSEVEGLTQEDMDWIRQQSQHEKVVAIGEIGLDYHWPEPGKEIQKEWFEKQLDIATQVNLPVIIHSRDAAADTLDILKAWNDRKTAGVIHCYSYTKEMAREYLNMDYYFGIGGVLTFKNAKKLIEAVEYIPIHNILLETDCPYLAPEPYRGKRNQSDYISFVAEKMAEIKKMSKEEILKITWENAKCFYKI